MKGKKLMHLKFRKYDHIKRNKQIFKNDLIIKDKKSNNKS